MIELDESTAGSSAEPCHACRRALCVCEPPQLDGCGVVLLLATLTIGIIMGATLLALWPE